ncbi:hypothetical protein [Streptomyces sp. R33]|uniref:Uncharacterized protein n=1 Tax=Streptomyces sp. R33 TaxID=3238629 RepID=A0AB39Y7H5_9ACTN
MGNDQKVARLTVTRRKRSSAQKNYRRAILALMALAVMAPPYESPSMDLKIITWLLISLVVLMCLYFVFASDVVRGILASIFKEPRKDTILTIE